MSIIAQTRFGTKHSIRGIPEKEKEVPAMTQNPRDQEWQGLADKASTEMDAAKLTILIAQLCNALDARSRPPQLSHA